MAAHIIAAVGAVMGGSTVTLSLRWKLVVLLVLAAGAALTSYQAIQHYIAEQAHNRQQEQQRYMQDILVLSVDLDAGTRVELEHLQQRKFPPKYVQDNWLQPQDATSLIGLRTGRFLARGEPLTLESFSHDYSRFFSQRLAEGEYAITTSISVENLHHGMLAVGDKVAIVASGTAAGGDHLLAVSDVSVLALDNLQYSQPGPMELASTITFSMTAEQAIRFESIRRSGFQIWLQHPQHAYSRLTVPVPARIHQMQVMRTQE